MRAIVMAGGEGTRLRPLTSNQPKPMVPVVGKPCMEHILELLHRYGIDEVTITLAFMPQAIRTYFGDGETLGMSIDYSVEEEPLGTAGSVRQAARDFEEPFLVISGDALCDIDLQALIDHHEKQGGAVTIASSRWRTRSSSASSSPTRTGAWSASSRSLPGARSSPTRSTPASTSSIPRSCVTCLPTGPSTSRPISSRSCSRWDDRYTASCSTVTGRTSANLDQYRQANFDALDEKVHLKIPGIRLRGDIWIGEGVEIDDLESIEGPAFIGNYSAPGQGREPWLHSVARYQRHAARAGSGFALGARLLDSRRAQHSDRGLGDWASCDLRSHVRLHEGVAIGDEVTIGAESVIWPGVRIYPYKEVESGAQIHESLIWESRATTRLFGQDGVLGLVNVDLTPEVAVRLATAAGTALKQGARVVTSREAPTACRMIKRAMISGLNSTGVDVADLRVLPASINRHCSSRELRARHPRRL